MRRIARSEHIELGADTLFNLRAMERAEQVPFIERVLHEYQVMPHSICHAADAHEKAEQRQVRIHGDRPGTAWMSRTGRYHGLDRRGGRSYRFDLDEIDRWRGLMGKIHRHFTQVLTSHPVV